MNKLDVILMLVIASVLALGTGALNSLNDGRVLTVVNQLVKPQVQSANADVILKRGGN